MINDNNFKLVRKGMVRTNDQPRASITKSSMSLTNQAVQQLLDGAGLTEADLTKTPRGYGRLFVRVSCSRVDKALRLELGTVDDGLLFLIHPEEHGASRSKVSFFVHEGMPMGRYAPLPDQPSVFVLVGRPPASGK